MKKNKWLIFVAFFLMITICSWKGSFRNISKDRFIEYAVLDFMKSSPLHKKDIVFSVDFKRFGNKSVGVAIYGSKDKVWVLKRDSIIDFSVLPSKYIEIKGRLFYWYDKENTVSREIIDVFKKYNFIDTAIYNRYIPSYSIDEDKKGEHYYFCEKSVRKFKKVRTNKAMGNYPFPNLLCDK